jgi:DNA-binding XRE family transcriptional regulator
MPHDLPQFEISEDEGGLADFAIKLRLAVFKSKDAAARSLGVHPTTIGRYESGSTLPQLGYLASLSRLLLAKSDKAGLSDAERATQQQHFLTQLKELVRWFPEKYGGKTSFLNWVQLCEAADHYERKHSEQPPRTKTGNLSANERRTLQSDDSHAPNNQQTQGKQSSPGWGASVNVTITAPPSDSIPSGARP